jgi:patatin-like phospholipase/acyl hydrolase
VVRILSIDGGGIRGIIPARILQEIEETTGKAVADLFDLIAGTSTGGILALGLTKPAEGGRPQYCAADLVELYEAEGPRIFNRSTWHYLKALNNLADEKYDSSGIEEVLHEYFGETRLSDALTNLMVTSYDIERRAPYFFKSYRAADSRERDTPMADAARATSAAPTYFAPHRINIPGRNDYRALVDGGVFANNPTMCAYAEAKGLFPNATDYLVISIGTGELTRRIPIEEAEEWGLAMWAQPLLGVVFDGVSDTVDYQVRTMCRTDTDIQPYHRLQVTLTEGNDDMDDTTTTNLRALRILAERFITDSGKDLQTISRQLTA